jgi:hypothetical protein
MIAIKFYWYIFMNVPSLSQLPPSADGEGWPVTVGHWLLSLVCGTEGGLVWLSHHAILVDSEDLDVPAPDFAMLLKETIVTLPVKKFIDKLGAVF